ncbi:Fic family protein [Calidifontibacter indicus]|uniref:Fic family protein n=1 Tax=Calidifontibacter indicus TaxID=419650 RepID=UPI003D7511D0
MSDVVAAVNALAQLPEVPEAIDAAREACTALRWHPALRRRIPEASAESRVRGATASAALDGAQMSVTIVRDVFRGARTWPADPDPLERTVAAALRVSAATEQVRSMVVTSPRQALARLHTAAMAELLPADQVGRPRRAGEDSREMLELGPAPDAVEATQRLDQICELLSRSAQLPTVVVAAVVHAELVAARPFVHGNALVARAFERALVWGSGLDPTGVAVPEQAHHSMATDYQGALGAYASGDPQGVRLWVLHEAAALTRAAGAGHDVCDAVLAGRLTSDSSGSLASDHRQE